MNTTNRSIHLSNIVLAGGGLIAGIVLPAYIIYLTIFVRNDDVLFCVVLTTPFVLSSAVLFWCRSVLSEEIKLSITIILLSIVTTLYLLEVFLQTNQHIRGQNTSYWHRVAKSLGEEFDTRTKIEVIRDLQKKGFDAYPEIPAEVLVRTGFPSSENGRLLYPLTGISDAITVGCYEPGHWPVFTTDEFGFKNSVKTHIIDEVDILITGVISCS